MPHAHNIEKCFGSTSADLAQANRGYPHSYLLGEQLDQHHGSALTICHFINTFKSGKWRFSKTHNLTMLEQRFDFLEHLFFLLAEGNDQSIRYLNWLNTKTH